MRISILLTKIYYVPLKNIQVKGGLSTVQ